jgi:hypothetical protein
MATGSAGGLVGSQDIFDSGTNAITNSYRYEFVTLNGTVIPAASNDINGIHGGIKSVADLMTKATYTGNSWLFNDSAPTAGPWHWDSRGFPKLNMGTENWPWLWSQNGYETVITITTQPVPNTTVTQGSITGSLSVNASVTQGATLSYQWYSNNTNSNTGGTIVSGATNSSFTIPTTLTTSGSPYYYYCEVRATGATSVRSNVAAVTVLPASITVTGVTVTPNTATIEVNATRALTANVTPPNANDRSVTWSSSNTAVATVNSLGVVTAVSAGTATITARSNSNQAVADTCTVTVTDPEGCNVGFGYHVIILLNAMLFVLRRK